MKTAAFKKDDTVEWISQSHGYEKTKRGKIEIIVPANEDVRAFTDKLKLPGFPRDHESYVVTVNGKLYWPRVSALKLVKRRR